MQTSQQRQCESCGRPFTPRDPRHRQCSNCHRPAPMAREGQPAHARHEIPQGPGSTTLTAAGGYLTRGYFDENGYIRPEIIGMEGDARPSPTSPSMVSRAVYALANVRVAGQVPPGIAYSQLYRFFDQARAIERRLVEGEPFAALVARVVGLQPKAAIVVSREVAPVSFKDFIDTNAVLARESPHAFRDGFVQHYQSVLCYYKYFNPKR